MIAEVIITFFLRLFVGPLLKVVTNRVLLGFVRYIQFTVWSKFYQRFISQKFFIVGKTYTYI